MPVPFEDTTTLPKDADGTKNFGLWDAVNSRWKAWRGDPNGRAHVINYNTAGTEIFTAAVPGVIESADGDLVTVGATTDAEAAAGDGSVIAILKRLRTLLAGTLTVGGTVATTSADGGHVTVGATTDAESVSGNATVIALLKRIRTLSGGAPAAPSSVTGTIAANASISSEVDLTNFLNFALHMPSAWTAAALTFLGMNATGGSYDQDAFTRANSAVSAGSTDGKATAWTPTAGTWGISSNALYQVNADSVNGMLMITALADIIAEMVYTPPALDNAFQGLMYRGSDASNNWRVLLRRNAGNLDVSLAKRVAGVNTSLGSYLRTGVTPCTIRVVASGSSHKVYVDGILRISATDSDLSGGTGVGFTQQDADASNVNTRFDSFWWTGAANPVFPLYDDAGTEISITTDSGRVVGIATASKKESLKPVRFVLLRSGTQAAPLIQAEARTITVLEKG